MNQFQTRDTTSLTNYALAEKKFIELAVNAFKQLVSDFIGFENVAKDSFHDSSYFKNVGDLSFLIERFEQFNSEYSFNSYTALNKLKPKSARELDSFRVASEGMYIVGFATSLDDLVFPFADKINKLNLRVSSYFLPGTNLNRSYSKISENVFFDTTKLDLVTKSTKYFATGFAQSLKENNQATFDFAKLLETHSDLVEKYVLF